MISEHDLDLLIEINKKFPEGVYTPGQVTEALTELKEHREKAGHCYL